MNYGDAISPETMRALQVMAYIDEWNKKYYGGAL